MANDSLEYEDWIKKAEYDIGTAEINLANARYDAVASSIKDAREVIGWVKKKI